MRKLIASLAVLLLVGTGSVAAYADDAKPIPFATSKDVDLTTILPPPPANDSAQTKIELAEVLSIQVTRTPEMVASAQADVEENVWRFANVMGPNFTKETLPKFAAFFDRVVETEGAVVDPAKDFWKRPRPHQLSELVKPAVKLSNSGSWPSGHATVGTLMGIVLSNMVPEKRAEIMARAWDFGNNRLIGGIHFRSDIDMGRIAGSVIAFDIMQKDDFKTQYDEAKTELRAKLGL
jgi:acid phosphatase (class A)